MAAPFPASSPSPGFRLAIVLSHPTQYYSPWFRWLAQRGWDLRVFYLWDFGVREQRDPQFGTVFRWDVDLLSGYAHEFVANSADDPGTHHFGGLRNPELTSRLAAWRPDAVLLFGYRYASHLRLIAWARFRGVPLIFRGDSHLLGRAGPRLLARWALGLLFRQFEAFLPVGVANREYFRAYGVREERLHFSPHAVEAERFDPADQEIWTEAGKVRQELGIPPDAPVVLFSGKLIPAKAPLPLLQAFLALDHPRAVLIVAGQGEEESTLRTEAAAAKPGQVHFLPFANQREMPVRYALADVFALPSVGLYETWGLAVNEAMHLGVPALVSDQVGCQRDLVEHGVTGWVFPAHQPEALAPVLTEAIDAVTADRAGWSLRARERVAKYSYAAASGGLAAALEAVRRTR